MREVSLGSINQYFSRCDIPLYFRKSTKIWIVDLHDSQLERYKDFTAGLSASIIDEATEISQNWVGWGFYKNTEQSLFSAIPVLMFASKEDAMVAHLRWTGNALLSEFD